MEHNLKRLYAIFAIVIVIVAVVSFMGGYYSHTSTITSTPQKITITYFDDLAPSESSFMKNTIIPQFENIYKNITITYIDESATSIISSIETLEQAHDVGTTVIAEDNMVIGELLYGHYLMNLSSIAANMEPSSMIPSMKSIVSYELTAFGGIYFIPLRANVPLVFYNKTMLSSAGISSPPSNITELMNDGKLLKNKYGQGEIMFQGHGGASTATELFQWMVQFGGNPLEINDNGDLKAFAYLDNLSTNGYFSPNYVHGYWGNYKGLANGAYGILDYQWPYIYSILTSPPYNLTNNTLGLYPGPAGPSNSDHLIGGDVLAVPSGATHLYAIEQWAHYLLSSQVQREFILNLSWPAVNLNAYKNLPANVTIVYKAEEAAMANPVFRPPVPWITEWNALIDEAFVKIVEDQASSSSIQSILNTYHTDMYNYLLSTYNSTVAKNYQNGVYTPLYP